jgi:pimeloyl-ACP methyl ester carboxylesterase
MSGRLIDTPSGPLFVLQEGDGDPLLLINGLGGSHALWEPLVSQIGPFSTIAVDAPGTGLSPPPRWPPGIPAFAQMIRATIESLGYRRIDVLGYSFGGAVAQELARQAPDVVRRLVLVAATPGWGGIPATPWAAAALSTPLRMYSRWYYRVSSEALVGGEVERDPGFVRRAEELRRRHAPSVYAYVGQLIALACWSSLPWLTELRQPTLVINGDDDPVVPWANGALLASRIPHARLRLQPREGHYLLLDRTSSSMPAIDEFLSADTYRDTPTWCEADEVSAADARRAVQSCVDTAQPQGAMSALFRMYCDGEAKALARN